MKYQIKQTTGYVAILLMLFMLSGCAQVKLVAAYDKEVIADTFSLAKRVDLFWANYLVAKGESRKYGSIKNEMIGIEVELNSLLLKNEARDKNKQTTKQIKNVIKIWSETSKLFIQQGSISNTSAKSYRLQMADSFKYIVRGEKAKNISDNNDNTGSAQ